MRAKAAGLITLIIIAGLAAVLIIHTRNGSEKPMPNNNQALSSSLSISSTAFEQNAKIPVEYTCKGQNISPPLNISGVSAGAKSLTLIMHDPDAVGSDYTHWVVYDMPASTLMIAANSVPVGALQGLNGSGQAKYFGPCPPAGTGIHHYKFDLYVLDKSLGLNGKISREQVESAMDGHIIDQKTLTGLFSAD